MDSGLERKIPTTYSPPTSPGSAIAEVEDELARRYHSDFPVLHGLWSEVITLHSTILERRADWEQTSPLRTALDLLGAKGMSDARGAHILLSRGYAMASLGPLRAAQETSDLMRFLLQSPDDAELWAAEDSKFDSLGWIRDELEPVAREGYRFMNWGLHPNWALIPEMLRKEVGPVETHYEIIAGPVRDRPLTGMLSAINVHQTLMILAVLNEHEPTVVSDIWRDSFLKCTERLTTYFAATNNAWQEIVSIRSALAGLSVQEKAP